jgi:hypothetical protein
MRVKSRVDSRMPQTLGRATMLLGSNKVVARKNKYPQCSMRRWAGTPLATSKPGQLCLT